MKLNKIDIYRLIIIMVISGIFGFIYETIFYRIDLGYFVKRGTTYGPWIPIYAFGGLFITLFTYKLKDKPILVFTINTIVTSLLEYFTGYFLLKFKNIRLWDYNNEILNYGNINGFICLRSVLFFGLSSLFLIYLIIPFIKKIPDKLLSYLSIILGSLFLLDFILYRVI